jgi:hypothetical protein
VTGGTSTLLCDRLHKHIAVLPVAQAYCCVTGCTSTLLCYRLHKHIAVLPVAQAHCCVTGGTSTLLCDRLHKHIADDGTLCCVIGSLSPDIQTERTAEQYSYNCTAEQYNCN